MSWERVVAGLEALGTGTPGPAASFADALAAAGMGKTAIVATPTLSRKRKRKQDPAGDMSSLLGAGVGRGGALAAYLATKPHVADRGVHEVVSLPGENSAATIRGEVSPLASRPAEVEGRGPYVKLVSDDFPGAIVSHGGFSSRDQAMGRISQLMRQDKTRDPVTLEIDTHGAPGVLSGRTGSPIPLDPGEQRNLMVAPRNHSYKMPSSGTSADFGHELSKAVGGRPGSLSSAACNFAVGPDGQQAGQDMADASGLRMTFNRGYGLANPWKAHTVRGDEKWLPSHIGRPPVIPGSATGTTTTFERGKAPRDRFTGTSEDGSLTRRPHFVNPLNQGPLGKLFQPAYDAGPLAALLGGIGGAALPGNYGAGAAIAGTAGTLPMLLSEIGASYGKVQGRLHHGQGAGYGDELSRLAPYLALSAAPGLAYGVSRLLGRDRKKNRTKRAFDEQAVEDAGVMGDENAVARLVSDPAPPPAADLLKKWVSYTKKLDSRGDFVGTGHKRIAIPKANLSEDELKTLGFQSVVAGIPETGQDRFSSLRRVDDNHHLHSHPDYWTMHLDDHPSMTMALQRAEGPVEQAKAVIGGTSHVLGEGVPGAFYYLRGQLGGSAGMVNRLGRLARIRKKSVKKANLGITIDRPKGFQKVFQTPAGPVTRSYPVDYGFFDGVTNPDDNEGADVFVGDGTLHGRFMKGKNLSGKWEPDERKWYKNLTPDQLSAVREMFTSQSPDLLRDDVQFADEAELARDLATLKTADLKPGIELQPHQERVKKKVQTQLDETGKARLLLYHSLGSGKSLSGLAAADDTGIPYTAITPASLRGNMVKEQDKFLDKATAPAGDVMSQTAVGNGSPVRFKDSLLVDEMHRLRNPETAQAKKLLGLAQRAKQVVMLSGTPIVNDPGDFATIHQVLTGKKMSPDEFYGRYVREGPEHLSLMNRLRGRKAEQGPGLQHTDELKKDLEGKVDYHAPATPKARVDREEVAVEMTPDQTKLYKSMYGKLPRVLRWKLEHDYPMKKDELSRLTSFMTGPRQVGLSTLPFMKDKKDPVKAFEGSPKLQAAMERLQKTLKADPNSRALVFSNFIEAGLSPYQKALERAGVPAASFTGKLNDKQRKQLVDDYNVGKLRVALLGPSGTEGLSFKGTRLVQLLDPHWNNVRGRQSEGRALRFDSHDHLPEDQRQVTVQRFIARTAPEGMGKLKRILHLGGEPGRAADDYLGTRAQQKEELNEKFLGLLQQIGTGR